MKINTHQRRSYTNLLLDVTIFVGFLLATAPRLTGLEIHEWLSLAFGAAAITHVLLHWEWIVGITKKFLSRASAESRINYVLNALLFIIVTIIIATGVLISEEALPWLGIQMAAGRSWRVIHRLASDAGVIVIGLHVALHWRWIVNTTGRLVGLNRRNAPQIVRPQQTSQVAVRQEVQQ